MKPFCKAAVCFLLGLIFCSCAPETDFAIPRETVVQTESEKEEISEVLVVINKNSYKYHLNTDCVYAARISPENRLEITVPDENYLKQHGYSVCLKCIKDK